MLFVIEFGYSTYEVSGDNSDAQTDVAPIGFI